jgi:hypothetical protein
VALGLLGFLGWGKIIGSEEAVGCAEIGGRELEAVLEAFVNIHRCI